NDVFATTSTGTYPLEGHYQDISFYYDPTSQMRLVTFIDNHDVPRFLSIPGSTTNRLALALTFQLTSRLGGDGGLLYRTTDAGGSWTKLPGGSSLAVSSIFFTDANTGYAVGDNGGYWKYQASAP
ncbi:MAG: hypothetical protein ACR2H1_01580, partial [Limisphaerales bacterium]